MSMRNFVVLLGVLPAMAGAQPARSDSAWTPMLYFIGEWTGTSKGEPGAGVYERSYRRVLDNRFIEVRNKSTYPPSPQNRNRGEVHEDVGYVSYDRIRKSFMLRQFHVEGFVNHYKAETVAADGSSIVFVSEALENLPAGFRARETYRILGPDEFMEIFEVAEPGKDFAVYSEARLRRKR
jgi:hypothetical protein